ncbi:hypothetical protein CU102_24695 [Phyllobacterium brassicacearum]|uniref:Uncharacterized protein n=2 Tax=Phyllobacterium brassicacearum TaxID=314235 RepID=A0A2P7B910_9HYPH|nr:hypothetical protein CU102_24695 [Phyllobacterium brassicacearum]
MGLIEQNIQTVPEIRLDEKGIAHRIRIFEDPRSPPMIFFSKRALARYKSRFDVLNQGIAKKSAESFCSMICLLLGRELLMTNRFVGAAYIAHAFTKFRAARSPDADIVENMLQAVRESNQAAIINLFVPLAHEIGHLGRSQALAPAEIHSDTFFDTYRISHEEIRYLIGDLDYASCQEDQNSPLFLPLLKEEAISDWFAVTAVFALVARTSREFQLDQTFGNLVMFPLVAALEEICIKEWRSTKFLQEVLLATQCRFSLLIDSIRANARYLFPRNHSDIDEAISAVENNYQEALGLLWQASIQLRALSREIVHFSDAEVSRYISERTHKDQWLPSTTT